MKKELKDYLHLYLGCEVEYRFTNSLKDTTIGRGLLTGVQHTRESMEAILYLSDIGNSLRLLVADITPILRPLSSMTEEEAIGLYCVSPYSKHRSMIEKATFNKTDGTYQPNIITIYWSGRQGNMTASYGAGHDVFYLNKLDPDQHHWMYKNRFDVHRLIEAGLAIDSTTQNP